MSAAQAERQRRDWEEIAAEDPYWAILSSPEGKYGRWDRDAFLRTGEEEIAALMTRAEALGRPLGHGEALDFGCGVGRATSALARRFDRCLGLDISEAMIREANALNADLENCTFRAGSDADLPGLARARFDLVYSSIVLQHLPNREAIEACISELVRVLRPGGLLAFQLPTRVPPAIRLQPRRNLYSLLKRLGVSPGFLYWRLGLHPMRMRAIPSAEVSTLVTASGGELLEVDETRDPRFHFPTAVYYATHG